MTSNAARFFEGDILYGRMRPYLNKVVLLPFEGLSSAEFIVFPATEGMNSRFLLWRLLANDFVEFACSQYEGDRPRVKFDQLGKFQLLLPPAAEQTRIVAKLEELLSDLDAGVAELKAAQKKLAQYRQSLLKAAVEGALTADWRAAQAAHPATTPAESGAALLARILVERRSRWQARQRAKFQAQGKTPPKDWQAKYPEPVVPDTSGLPELPQGWVWVSLDQIFCELRSGTAETSGRQQTNFPLLKSSAVRQGRVDWGSLNFLNESQSGKSDNYLEIGDVLITRLSGSVEYVGCCAVVAELKNPRIQYPDRIFCGKLSEPLMWLGNFLAYCFQSAYIRKRVESAAKSSAGHKRISLSDLHPMPIPLPPSSEIRVILERMDEAVQRIQLGDRDVTGALRQSAAQRKNILQAAFSGQLVPQDPADEPASALLARIRAERAERAGRGKSGRGGAIRSGRVSP